MNSQTLFELVIGVAVLGLLIYRNLRARPVRQANQRIYLVLGVVGVVETFQYLNNHHTGAIGVVALLGSLVLAVGFGAVRAMTVRVWMKDGQPWAQGHLLTAVLWILALAAHLGYDAVIGNSKHLSGLGSATVLLYLAASLITQRLIVQARAQRLDPTMAVAH
jgi:drug/metabolite transporter (DMT)-like permease